MKRLSGSELARAVLKQQEAQRGAALALQLAWKKRKVGGWCVYTRLSFGRKFDQILEGGSTYVRPLSTTSGWRRQIFYIRRA